MGQNRTAATSRSRCITDKINPRRRFVHGGAIDLRAAPANVLKEKSGMIRLALLKQSAAAALGLVMLAGCETVPMEPSPNFIGDMVVASDYAQFFRLGPQQAGGADLSLRTGERVMLQRKEFGYSRVQLENGQVGYMANEDITPAPPEPKPTPGARKPSPRTGSRSRCPARAVAGSSARTRRARAQPRTHAGPRPAAHPDQGKYSRHHSGRPAAGFDLDVTRVMPCRSLF